MLKRNYDVVSLVGALLFLLAAIMDPYITATRNIHGYLVFVDVTQSMNVQDVRFSGKPISRLEYTKLLLKRVVKTLPCGSNMGLGIFFKNSAAVLYTPLETCSNYDVLIDTIDHLEWRMASHGSSNIRLGLQSISSIISTLGEPAQVVFITDGEEAPPLNVFSKTKLSDWQGGQNWLLVGVGGNRPTPVPKLDENNKVIGYWSIYSVKIQPATQVNEGPNDARDESIATESYEYYLSKLDEPYLKELAIDINARYIRADSAEKLIEAMQLQQTSPRIHSRFQIKNILAFCAFILVISYYLKDMIRAITSMRKHRI